MKNKKIIYGAYGSNMNITQMKARCPLAKVIDTGILKDYKLTFKGPINGVANIESCLNNEVPIVLWAITEMCEKSLDRYEGFPSFYIKKSVAIELENGNVIYAMVYVMNEKYESMPAIPSERYYNIIKDGYNNHGLNDEFLSKAVSNVLEAVDLSKWNIDAKYRK